MATNLKHLEDRLWNAADQLRANSHLKSSEYSVPVLGLIFLRYADVKFAHADEQLKAKFANRRRGITRDDYQEMSVVYLPDKARWNYLLHMPEGADLGKALNDAMTEIEKENEDLRGILPKTYTAFDKKLLVELLKSFNSIPMDIEGDAFGKIYEYFLGKFAMSEGQKGGEFFTPTSIVKLIVEIIQPFEGTIYDPACGSGGMFVQSADFVTRHKGGTLSVYGQERVEETVRLCKMNLAVHGLGGSILQGNSYYSDPFEAVGKFNYVMANPPFNVDGVNKEDLAKRTDRFPYGMPKNDNANYIWIQMFLSSLASNGRAGFVMANSASDARQSELEIRKQMIQAGVVDVMVAVGSNMFYTVTLPVTLWFLDKGKQKTKRRDQILFIDARSIYTQIDRAHREWSEAQLGLIATLARLYRSDDLNGFKLDESQFPHLTKEQLAAVQSAIKNRKYADIAGLCKIATLKEVETQGWSLNSGRYVGVTEKSHADIDFAARLEELNEELEILNTEARELEEKVTKNVTKILEQ
ncbi:MAG TPA: class I SAM-dependent DNA methyltransferase [Anaerolineales bacterium]|nr:class I SAM-dependent DNA methyltransferase [Anaerolineales bacterium]